MEYLPDVYQHLERAFPHVHSAHQELAKACYEVRPRCLYVEDLGADAALAFEMEDSPDD